MDEEKRRFERENSIVNFENNMDQEIKKYREAKSEQDKLFGVISYIVSMENIKTLEKTWDQKVV